MSSRVFSLAKYPQKQDYPERNSEVDMYNMYDDIEKVPKLEEIMQMDIEKGRALIEAVKEKHNVKDLCRHWGKSDNYFYTRIVPKFGIKTRKYKTSKQVAKKEPPANQLQHYPDMDKILEKQRNDIVQAAVLVKNGVVEILDKLRTDEAEGEILKFKGTYNGGYISDRLLAYGGMLQEDKKYKVAVTIIEDTEGNENGQTD